MRMRHALGTERRCESEGSNESQEQCRQAAARPWCFMLFGLVFARGGAGGGDAVAVVVLLLFLLVIDTFATLNDAPCGFICRFILLAKRATGPFLVVIIKFGRRATADHLGYSRVKVAIVLLMRGRCQCSAAITHKSNDIVRSGASRAVVIRDGQLVDQAAHVLASRHAVRRRWNAFASRRNHGWRRAPPNFSALSFKFPFTHTLSFPSLVPGSSSAGPIVATFTECNVSSRSPGCNAGLSASSNPASLRRPEDRPLLRGASIAEASSSVPSMNPRIKFE